MSKEQSKEENSVRNKDWKKCLSGALSDLQIKIAMMVLSLFSIVYTLYNSFVVKSNEQDEGDIIRNCTCKESHRNFYIGWSAFCFIIWFIFHLLNFLYTTAPCQCAKKPIKDLIETFSSLKRRLLASLSTAHPCAHCKKKDDDVTDQGENQYTKERRDRGWQCIYQYQELILSQLREKYAIGYKMPNHRMDVTEAIQLLLSIELCREETEILENNDFRRSQPHSEQGDEPDGEQDSVTNTSFVVTKPTIYRRIIKNTTHLLNILLRLARFIVQLSVVPLLMVQIFDTYTFLCLIESEQCDRISQYRVHLVQTAVSFSFYASLMISLLTTIWLLKLVPWDHYSLSMPLLNLEPSPNFYTLAIQNDHQQQSPNIDINNNNSNNNESIILHTWICK